MKGPLCSDRLSRQLAFLPQQQRLGRCSGGASASIFTYLSSLGSGACGAPEGAHDCIGTLCYYC